LERNHNISPDSQLGPGQYDPINKKYPDINYSFSQLDRPEQVTRDQRAFPAPGTYQQPGLFCTDGAPKYTIGEKHPGERGDDVPGPGTYSSKYGLVHPSSPVTKINPHSAETPIPYTPGPGQYDP
jgi:hypothetical protein